jgi:hypothetical protein
MTAVSNPNNRPPSAPTPVAFSNVEFSFINARFRVELTRV